jgi:hypothetical protein
MKEHKKGLALWLALSVAALAGMALTAQKTKRK